MTRLLLTTDTLGGVWRYTVELAASWSRSGHDLTVATLGPRAEPAQRAELASIPRVSMVETDLALDWTAPDRPSLGRASDALARIARTHGAERIHLHAPALVGDADWPAPVVAVIHSCLRTWWRAMQGGVSLPAELVWRDAAAAAGLRRADAAIAPGRHFAREVACAYGVAETAIHAVPNGAGPCATGVSLRPRTRAVLGCGRAWDLAKDFATLEDAAGRLPPDIPVRLAGALRGPNGECSPRLERVEALGSVAPSRLAARRREASVFVSTARYEPFGLAILEAAQSGLALVLADLPSLREHWDGAALFFPPGDGAALAARIRDAIGDPAPLAALASTRATVFTPARMADATAAVHGLIGPA